MQPPMPPTPPSPHYPPGGMPPMPPRPVFGQMPPAPPAAPGAAAGHGDATVATDANFAKVVEDPGSGIVLVECWAEWCATCRLLLPTIQLLARELKGRATVCTLNADENPATAAKLQLQSMPTILVYKDGRMVNRIFGMQTKGKLLAALQQAGMA